LNEQAICRARRAVEQGLDARNDFRSAHRGRMKNRFDGKRRCACLTIARQAQRRK
jgi:hypothetical protein